MEDKIKREKKDPNEEHCKVFNVIMPSYDNPELLEKEKKEFEGALRFANKLLRKQQRELK